MGSSSGRKSSIGKEKGVKSRNTFLNSVKSPLKAKKKVIINVADGAHQGITNKLVDIHFINSPKQKSESLCRGILISAQSVLTTASCVSKIDAEKLRVYFFSSLIDPYGGLHKVDKAITHKEYNPQHLDSLGYDLAILKINQDVVNEYEEELNYIFRNNPIYPLKSLYEDGLHEVEILTRSNQGYNSVIEVDLIKDSDCFECIECVKYEIHNRESEFDKGT
ncbi:hypothetical protein AYI68_g5215, partial [Smittium mucronatum]